MTHTDLCRSQLAFEIMHDCFQPPGLFCFAPFQPDDCMKAAGMLVNITQVSTGGSWWLHTEVDSSYWSQRNLLLAQAIYYINSLKAMLTWLFKLVQIWNATDNCLDLQSLMKRVCSYLQMNTCMCFENCRRLQGLGILWSPHLFGAVHLTTHSVAGKPHTWLRWTGAIRFSCSRLSLQCMGFACHPHSQRADLTRLHFSLSGCTQACDSGDCFPS